MSTAFICPLYDMKNHFDLALDLYKSKIEYGIESDLIFIFSNEEQKDKFQKKLQSELGIDGLQYSIIPQELEKYSAKAGTKKLYGLKKYMNDYDYIILTDCEAAFVKKFNTNELAEHIWNTKSMLAANVSPDGFYIMRACYKAMGLYYDKKLRKALGNFKYNFWFNELQVYKCEYLVDFFEWMKGLDIEKIYNTSSCFEYYVFYAYLCLKHDVKIKKYHYVCMGGINEYMDLFSLKKQKQIIKKMDLHWTSSKEPVSDQIVMRFHLDRNRTSGGYGYDNAGSILKTIRLTVKRYLILIKEYPEMRKAQRTKRLV